jgi:hypothetical protein
LTELLHNLKDNQDLIRALSISAGVLYEKELSGEIVYSALAQNLEEIFERWK